MGYVPGRILSSEAVKPGETCPCRATRSTGGRRLCIVLGSRRQCVNKPSTLDGIKRLPSLFRSNAFLGLGDPKGVSEQVASLLDRCRGTQANGQFPPPLSPTLAAGEAMEPPLYFIRAPPPPHLSPRPAPPSSARGSSSASTSTERHLPCRLPRIRG